MINLQRTFYKGMRVKSYTSWDNPDDHGNTTPEQDAIYTVRDIIDEQLRVPGCARLVGLLLKEIVNKPQPSHPDGRIRERCFNAMHFIPVDDKGELIPDGVMR